MRNLFLFLLLLFSVPVAMALQEPEVKKKELRPRVIIGLIIDQCEWEGHDEKGHRWVLHCVQKKINTYLDKGEVK